MADIALGFDPPIAAPRRLRWVERRALPAYRLLAVMIALVALLCARLGFAVDRQDLPLMSGALVTLMLFGMVLRSCGFGRAGSAMEGMALVLASTMATCCLTFLLAVSALPYRDLWLHRLDGLLVPGFAWMDMFRMLRHRDVVVRGMQTVYSSLLWQPFLLVAILTLSGREAQAWRFLHGWFLALVTCTAVFALMPAMGAYNFYHLTPADIPAMRLHIGWDQATALEAVRSGRLHALAPSSMTGIIAFPSFHAAGGVLLAHSFRRVPLIGLPLLLWNMAMIATAPLIGSHYFCDILAGIAVALFAIATARKQAAGAS